MMTKVPHTTAFWITDKNTGELRQEPLPAPSEGQVRVRTLFSGISRGTETTIFSGNVPPTEHERMRAPFQEGAFTFPVKYGYINIGTVEQGPSHLCGKTVFSLFPHQTHFNIPVDAVTELPPELPPERAVLAANMETAINALWDAQPCIGDKISVVGAGVLGALVAYLAAGITACEVQLIDINPEREALATALGLNFSLPAQAEKGRDLVIHTSTTSKGLNTALNLAALEATVLELSWFGDKAASVTLGGAFHSQRLQIKSSQVGHVASCQRTRWSFQRRLRLALQQLTDHRLDCLISGESHISTLPETLTWLAGDGCTSLCHRIRYD